MKKIYRNGLFILATGVLAVSCANYDITDGFRAEPDPSVQEPYKDYAPVKTYIDKSKYPNMTLGATLKVAEFNKQELAHAAAVTNFDNLAFGTTLMSGTIVNEKGIMNFLDMKDLLDHVEEIGGEVFGSPLAANENQADGWLNMLTAPIEIHVNSIADKDVDYTNMDEFSGTVIYSDDPIKVKKNYDGNINALELTEFSSVYIIEDFDVDPLGSYTITFYAKSSKDQSITCTFSDKLIKEKESDKLGKKYAVKAGKWVKVVVEATPAQGARKGYFMIEDVANANLYIQKVSVTHTPDNHRPQTETELKDTINYALDTWCDGVMKINEGRIKSFDLIDEPLGTQKLENGMYDLKHSTDKVYWQDVFGSEEYAPKVSNVARAAFERYGGNASELKFFISESGLDDNQKMESLKYWIGIWDGKGAKIDGINAKVNLTYSEDEAKQKENVASLDNLLTNLAATGKLIRISNFDIKYQDATGSSVAASDIKEDQRQKLADYYAYVIKSYMSKIPNDKQAGICKGNMSDTSDPVGLWTIDSKSRDWVRNATYKAFCDALGGK